MPRDSLRCDQGWGRIIDISGLGAQQASSIAPTTRNISVSASTKNPADELGPKGVDVTVVHPGLTRTERRTQRLTAQAEESGHPVAELEAGLAKNTLRRVIDLAEVADVVTFLSHPAASRSPATPSRRAAESGRSNGVAFSRWAVAHQIHRMFRRKERSLDPRTSSSTHPYLRAALDTANTGSAVQADPTLLVRRDRSALRIQGGLD